MKISWKFGFLNVQRLKKAIEALSLRRSNIQVRVFGKIFREVLSGVRKSFIKLKVVIDNIKVKQTRKNS